VQSTYDPDHQSRDVLLHRSDRAWQGYNFYNVWKHPTAYLIDMEGKVLHKWHRQRLGDNWHHAELLPNGDVIVVLKDKAVIKLDKSSALIWSYRTRAHHDLWVHDDGNIYFITREATIVPDIDLARKILIDKIVVLSPEGNKKDELSVLDLLRNSPYAYLLPIATPSPDETRELDILHTNHVEVFDGSKSHHSSLFKRGNLLISMLCINAIAIIDGESRKIVWLWGPTNLGRQHHPTLLDNGNILVFDNGDSESRILEISVPTGKILWTYTDGKKFHSVWGGANQRLQNGNTLITDTNRGYAFEVTSEGEVVWKFANPLVDRDGKRMNIWRLKRFQPSELPFIQSPSS
jgi:hypothetical protein